MNYSIHFNQITGHIPYLMGGALISLQIALLAFCGGMVLGLCGASIRHFYKGWPKRIVDFYVCVLTNTPQLVQIYFIYFALPESGILLSSFQAVLLGMTLNAGAYLADIQQAGFNSIRRSEVEAAETLGMSKLQSIRYVIFPHVMKVLFPPLSNQFIIMTLGTSMAAVFGLEELTGRAFNINSETFRSIEIFSVTAGMYFVVTVLATMLLVFVGRVFFRVEGKVF